MLRCSNEKLGYDIDAIRFALLEYPYLFLSSLNSLYNYVSRIVDKNV